MTCALCGAKSHNVRTCPLPGRDRYLKAQEHARKIHSWSKQPQKGRKPPRLGGVNKKFKKQRAVQYSGAKKVELQKKLEIKIARRRLVFRRLWSLNVQLLTPCNAWAFCKSLSPRHLWRKSNHFHSASLLAMHRFRLSQASQRPRSCLLASGRSSAPRIQSVSTSAFAP